MYLIPQDLANKIAKTVSLRYNLTRELFLADEEHANEMEQMIRTEVLKRTNSNNVARAVSSFLPLLMEQEAITAYQNKTGEYLRNIIPEILSPQEAALIAQSEIMMDQEETMQTEEMIQQIIQHQEALKNE